MIYGKFLVSNTGARKGKDDAKEYPGAVRVYLNSKMIGEIQPSSRNPLQYVRKHPGSKYHSHLLNILNDNGATKEEIAAIMGYKL